jgi:hypothetical protein
MNRKGVELMGMRRTLALSAILALGRFLRPASLIKTASRAICYMCRLLLLR